MKVFGFVAAALMMFEMGLLISEREEPRPWLLSEQERIDLGYPGFRGIASPCVGKQVSNPFQKR